MKTFMKPHTSVQCLSGIVYSRQVNPYVCEERQCMNFYCNCFWWDCGDLQLHCSYLLWIWFRQIALCHTNKNNSRLLWWKNSFYLTYFLLLAHGQTLTFVCTTREVFPNSFLHHGRQIVSNRLTFKIEIIIPSHMLNKTSKSKLKPRKKKLFSTGSYLMQWLFNPPPTLQMIKLFFESLTS